jgi:acyl transferase domain-containing protein/thioesterase domain-containing protein/acyl carrier protein
MSDDTRDWSETDIAVVGMAGRFPGARTPAELWQNVRRGVESVRPLSDEELREAGVDPALLEDPHYVKSCAPLDDMELFDSGFFGFSPREADIMDPQHRHFLECAWEALEDAGHPPEAFEGSIGVYGGCGMNAYFMFNLLTNPQLVKSVGLFLLRHTGNDKDFLTTRVSYLLNLTGPSVGVQTACSTSLVAIHVACQQLLAGECDLALAGGATIEQPHRVGYLYEEGEILSPDGHCRSFDAASKGTVFGSGIGVVALRRMADAIRDGDVIHAVVKGSAVNNDGATKVGYLAPSVDGQASSILEAMSVANVRAETMTYVETHGTGTPVGDPIEVAALTQAFRAHTNRSGFCAIGSLKSNIGHLDTAAGVASFIKVVQSLAHREIPPSLHFQQPNPAIDFGATPFWVNTQLRPWTPPVGTPRRAGVSSLGVGGTNAHVILEETPSREPSPPQRPYDLLLLSARTTTALDGATSRLARYFTEHADANVSDAAYTLAVGRRGFDQRRAVVVRDAADAAQALTALDTARAATGVRVAAPSVVMIFPGGGAQHPDMGRDLYREIPVFRDTVDRCLAIAAKLGHGHLRDLMYPAEGEQARAAKELEQPANSVLSVFIIEYALSQVWLSWGVEPAGMIGHSLGEYVAACLAGVMTLEDALALVATRGRLFGQVPAGGMLSVSLPEDELAALPLVRDGRLSIAAVNAPSLTVASGPIDAIAALEADLFERGVDARRLHINIAAHSPMLDAIVDEFAAFARTIRLSPPKRPFISNVTGTWADPAEVTTGDYWARHLRGTVRFSAGLATLQQEPGRFFLEVGPGQTLSSLTRLHRTAEGVPAVAPSLRHPQEAVSDFQPLYLAVGRVWMHGATVDWTAFHGKDRRRVSLPTYAFDHKRHWIAPGSGLPGSPASTDHAGVGAGAAGAAGGATFLAEASAGGAGREAQGVTRLQRHDDIANWAYVPVWKPAPRPHVGKTQEPHTWLLFAGDGPVSAAAASGLAARRQRVITVTAGDRFARQDDGRYQLRPDAREDYARLLNELAAEERLPDRALHLWLADARHPGASRASDAAADDTLDRAAARQRIGFDSLLAFVQGVGDHDPEHALQITAVTRGAAPVPTTTSTASSAAARASVYPEDATLLGLARVIPREYPGVTCQVLDLAVPASSDILEHALADQPIALASLRADGAWVPDYEHAPLPDSLATNGAPGLREGGVYAITGGTGGIGSTLAAMLAREHHARIALIARRPSPDLETLTQDGATVLTITADVTDPAAMQAAFDRVRQELGEINGVFHAAGVVDDGLMQTKAPEAAARVLAPKVAGTLAIAQALAASTNGAAQPDFLVLFSSTSALLGLVGQADYAAANAFLNAFATDRTARGLGRTIAVGWGAWHDTGMTARRAQAAATGSAASAVSATTANDATALADASWRTAAPVHPLLGARVESSADRRVYQADYRAETSWVLNEHRLHSGLAIVPGTAYIEIARAAWKDLSGDTRVEIGDLVFLSPLEVADGASRVVQHTLQRQSDGTWVFDTKSADPIELARGGDPEWIEHARGTVAPLAPAALGSHPIHKVRGRSGRVVTPGTGSAYDVWTKQGRHMRFGPRWNTLQAIHVGSSEALAIASLDEAYREDLREYGAHPALLDFSTAFALAGVPKYDVSPDLFVPFSYKRIRIAKPLPPSITAIAHFSGDQDATHDTVIFDIDVMTEQGEVVASIEEFTMRRLAPARLEQADAVRRARAAGGAAQAAGRAESRSPIDRLIEQGIRPAEGMAALTRALAAGFGPELLLSPIEWRSVIGLVDSAFPSAMQRSHAQARAARSAAAGAGAAARDDMDATETAIAGIWRDLLGADRVGPDDDFFALGGHSLIAVRLVARIEKHFKSTLRLSALFEAPTVRKLAALVRRGKSDSTWQALTPLRSSGSKPPLFCVHGVGGEVLSYSGLATRLDPERPFIAFRAPGHDGLQEPLRDIESQARLYVQEMRTYQREGPYYLAGYSHGGRVAFEMAQQLVAAGQTIAFLGILDTWPTEAWSADLKWAGRWLMNFPRWLADDLRSTSAAANMNRLKRGGRLIARQVKAIAAPFGARAHGPVITDHMDVAGLPDAIRRTYEANFEAFLKYSPKPYPGHLVVFCATAQPLAAPLEPDHGWSRFAQGGVTVVRVRGNHLNLIETPQVVELAAAMEQALSAAERVQNGGRPPDAAPAAAPSPPHSGASVPVLP